MFVYVYVFVFLKQGLMDDFNPSLQKLVSLGNSYVQAFQGKTERERKKEKQYVNQNFSL